MLSCFREANSQTLFLVGPLLLVVLVLHELFHEGIQWLTGRSGWHVGGYYTGIESLTNRYPGLGFFSAAFLALNSRNGSHFLSPLRMTVLTCFGGFQAQLLPALPAITTSYNDLLGW